MPVVSVLKFAGFSYTLLFQILAFSVVGCIFTFVCTVNATAHGNWHVDDTLFAVG